MSEYKEMEKVELTLIAGSVGRRCDMEMSRLPFALPLG